MWNSETGLGQQSLQIHPQGMGPATGLDYFGARYYGNWLGRWVSAEWSATPAPVPYADVRDPQSLNLYAYVRNLPTTKADNDGHDIVDYTCMCSPMRGQHRRSSYQGHTDRRG